MPTTFACPSCTAIDETQHLHRCNGLEGLIAPLVDHSDKARHVLLPREDYTLGDPYATPIMSCRTDHWDGSNDATVYAPTAVMELGMPRPAFNRSMRDISVNPEVASMGGRAHHRSFVMNHGEILSMREVARRLEATMAWTTSNGNAYYLYAMGTGVGKPGSGTPDSFKVALYGTSATPAQSATAIMTQWNGTGSTWVNANEAVPAGGNGYTLGGVAVTPVSWTQGTNVVTFTSSGSPQWTSATFTAYGGLIYDTTTSNQGISWNYFGGAQTVTSGTFSITWNASGILTLTC